MGKDGNGGKGKAKGAKGSKKKGKAPGGDTERHTRRALNRVVDDSIVLDAPEPRLDMDEGLKWMKVKIRQSELHALKTLRVMAVKSAVVAAQMAEFALNETEKAAVTVEHEEIPENPPPLMTPADVHQPPPGGPVSAPHTTPQHCQPMHQAHCYTYQVSQPMGGCPMQPVHQQPMQQPMQYGPPPQQHYVQHDWPVQQQHCVVPQYLPAPHHNYPEPPVPQQPQLQGPGGVQPMRTNDMRCTAFEGGGQHSAMPNNTVVETQGPPQPAQEKKVISPPAEELPEPEKALLKIKVQSMGNMIKAFGKLLEDPETKGMSQKTLMRALLSAARQSTLEGAEAAAEVVLKHNGLWTEAKRAVRDLLQAESPLGMIGVDSQVLIGTTFLVMMRNHVEVQKLDMYYKFVDLYESVEAF